jgi:hypothetical protein
MPKLVALERFYYGGRNVEMDEQFVAEEKDVALLTHAVKPMAKEAPRGEPDPPPEPEVDPEKQLGRTKKPDSETQGERRAYKRRDMKAED